MSEKRIKWHVEKRALSSLVPYDKNPRVITEQGLDDLSNSFDEIGFAQPININLDNTILSGHARVQCLKSEDANQEVDVYVPDRELTAKQEEAVIVRMNKNVAGKWDFDILANEFDLEDLKEWGFKDFELCENDNWESDIKSVENVDSHTDGIEGKIKITCSMDDKDAVLFYLKDKLMETSFNGVHIE
jgi:hypothetical protein